MDVHGGGFRAARGTWWGLLLAALIPPALLLAGCGAGLVGSADGAPGGSGLVANPDFEDAVADGGGTLDPAGWQVGEGLAEKGTGNIVEEHPELVQVTEADGGVRPYRGRRFLKVDARLYLKSHVKGYYARPVATGGLVQEVAVYPGVGSYLQQVEIRGRPDFREVEGNEIFHLRFTDEGTLLRVRTGRPDYPGQYGFWKTYSRLPDGQWNTIRIALRKAQATTDGQGRTVSQWKLAVFVNGAVIFDTDRDGVYAQYIHAAEFVFIGDETMSGTPRKMDPRFTGDGVGVVYYDAAYAYTP